MMRSSWVMAGAVVLAVGVGGPVGALAPSSGSAGSGGPVGDAVAIAAGVEVRAGLAGAYAGVAASQPVAVGDGVRTDATGFAEVAYSDGSRTRLDVNTEFEVVALVDDAGNAVTRTEMGVGRTWHRVQAVGAASGGFEVVTSQATAAGRGTAFVVSCLSVESCDYAVMEGVVDVTLADGTVVTVTAPATLDVTNGVATGPLPLSWDGLFGDPWLVANTDRDVEAGFADRATVYQAYGPGYASMVGDFTGTDTLTNVTCASICIEASGSPADIGTQGEYTPTFTADCSSGSCVIVGSAGVPYTFDGTSYSASIPEEPTTCDVDWGSDGVVDETSGTVNGVIDSMVTPTAAEVRDGSYVVTALERTATITYTVEGICVDGAFPPGVDTIEELSSLPQYLGVTGVWEATATR
jgi:hypothetical protein